MRGTRHGPLIAAALTVLAVTAACGAPSSGGSNQPAGDAPDKPSKAVTLNILDVAGNLQLTQGMIDEFVKASPDVVAKVTYSKSTAPEMPGKIKAQQSAGKVDIDLVLTGVDGLAAGIDQNLWTPLLPKYADRLAGMKDYLEPAAAMQKLAGNYGVEVTYYPSGPFIEYLPAKVPNPPTSAQALLDYAKAHPGKVQYARPANSGPGRTLPDGIALHPRRFRPEGPGQRLDEDLGVPEGAEQVRQLLPVRHHRDDEEPGQRIGRHHRQHHRLVHQPAGARHRAGRGEDPARCRASTGSPTRTTRSSRMECRRTSRPRCCCCSSRCSPRSSRRRPTTTGTSTPARRSRT